MTPVPPQRPPVPQRPPAQPSPSQPPGSAPLKRPSADTTPGMPTPADAGAGASSPKPGKPPVPAGNKGAGIPAKPGGPEGSGASKAPGKQAGAPGQKAPGKQAGGQPGTDAGAGKEGLAKKLNDRLNQSGPGGAGSGPGSGAAKKLAEPKAADDSKSMKAAKTVKDALDESKSPTQRIKEARDRGEMGAATAAREGLAKVGAAAGIPPAATRLALANKWTLGAILGICMLPMISLILVVALIFVPLMGGAISQFTSGGGYAEQEKTATYINDQTLADYKAVGSKYGVPWTIIAALGELATEQGKFSPYPEDKIDRDPKIEGLSRPSAGAGGGASAGAAPVAVGDRSVFIVGDSLCEPGGAQDGLISAVQAVGYTATADCKRGRPLADGIETMRTERNRVGSVAVIALGTNDAVSPAGSGAFPAKIDAMMGILSGVQVVWVNVGTKQPDAPAVNAALEAAKTRYTNLRVADFAATMSQHPDYQAGDGIHLNADGQRARSQLIAQTLNGTTAGQADVAPPNPPGIEISTYPVITPAIGDARQNQAQGPFLILPGPAKDDKVDVQRIAATDASPGDTKDLSASEYIASQLVRLRDQLTDTEHWSYDDQDEKSTQQLWQEVVSRLPVADPDNAACKWQGGAAGDAATMNTAIQLLWRCELNRAPELHTLRGAGDAAAMSRSEAVTSIVHEAQVVSWLFSNWVPQANCASIPGDKPAGVFPLTQAIFNAYKDPNDSGGGRCDPVANVHAAARAFVAGEQVTPGQRSGAARTVGDRSAETGPYNPMIGGWWAMPWALGDQAHLDKFLTTGPYKPWEPNDACRTAISTWLDRVAPNATDFADVAGSAVDRRKAALQPVLDRNGYQDLLADANCAGGGRASLVTTIAQMAFTRYQGDPSVGSDSSSDSSSTTSTTASGTTASTTAPVTGPDAKQLAANMIGVGIFLQTIATTEPGTTPADNVRPAVDMAVSRFSPNAVNEGNVPFGPGVATGDYAKKVVDLAIGIGGLIAPEDPRFDPNKNPFAALKKRTLLVGGLGSIPGVNPIVMDAYRKGSQNIPTIKPGCNVPVALLAAVGAQESGHGTSGGASPGPTGDLSPPIGGPPTQYGTAKGMMQFIDSSWASMGQDGNADGVKNVQNVYDAALGGANHLCISAGGTIANEDDMKRALFGYNHATWYVDEVMVRFREYQAILSAQGSGVGPDGCPTSAPAAFIDGDVNVAQLCAESVAQARTPQAAAAIKFALSKVGHGYCRGDLAGYDINGDTNRFGAGSSNCFDCSGFVWAAYMSVGIDIDPGGGKVTQTEWRGPHSVAIPHGSAQPGDILARTQQHTSMALAGGWQVHASGKNRGVRISKRMTTNDAEFYIRP